MNWPARSPDLNPIEHVWDFLGRRLAARTLPPVTIRELRVALQDEWAAMPQQLIDTLILSMGRRCETCLAEDHEERGSKIVWQALVYPTVTRSTIRADVGVAIVPLTISRHLAEANVKSKRSFRALPLTPEHRQLRLQWCQARSMWDVTDWQKVVFSDESRFVLGTDDNRVRVWRRPGERYNSPTLFYPTLPAQSSLRHHTIPFSILSVIQQISLMRFQLCDYNVRE
ncbi:transposable element Tcb2 transposase [Trichonephila clavipes]|nr:transposable element Tcb2 transposase [Trichonephila clavipes]